jgi:hypothetical protein
MVAHEPIADEHVCLIILAWHWLSALSADNLPLVRQQEQQKYQREAPYDMAHT